MATPSTSFNANDLFNHNHIPLDHNPVTLRGTIIALLNNHYNNNPVFDLLNTFVNLDVAGGNAVVRVQVDIANDIDISGRDIRRVLTGV